MRARDAIESLGEYLAAIAPILFVVAVFAAGMVAGWSAHHDMPTLTHRCPASRHVTIAREGADLVVRCAP